MEGRTDFETALRNKIPRQNGCCCESAFAASLDAYQHGLGTYVDVANAQRKCDRSRSVDG